MKRETLNDRIVERTRSNRKYGRRYSAEEKRKALEIYANGATQEQAAAAVGANKDTLRYWLREIANIPTTTS